MMINSDEGTCVNSMIRAMVRCWYTYSDHNGERSAGTENDLITLCTILMLLICVLGRVRHNEEYLKKRAKMAP